MIRVKPGRLSVEEIAWLAEDFYCESHFISPEVMKLLGLQNGSPANAIFNAYAAYGITPEIWSSPRITDGYLELVTFRQDHSQIEGVNLLLKQGFRITR